MSKNKLQRFAENLTFENLIQLSYSDISQPYFLHGRWCADHFKNDAPLILELGCGKGEYAIGLARNSLYNNYIGIDLKGARIWRGAKTALEDGLSNVFFIRAKVDMVDNLFGKDEVSEIWLTFSDPQLQNPRKRLSSPWFLEKYRRFVKLGGIIHLKTDNDMLYEFTLDVIAEQELKILYQTNDVYQSDAPLEVKAIQTFYENMFLKEGKNINYVKFILH